MGMGNLLRRCGAGTRDASTIFNELQHFCLLLGDVMDFTSQHVDGQKRFMIAFGPFVAGFGKLVSDGGRPEGDP